MPPTKVDLPLIRPLYEDQTSPAFLEYGVLKETGELWVEVFNKRDGALTLGR
jgi:hypothetical protein